MSKWAIHQGDALETLRGMPDASFDSVLCDPPYGLSFMGKEWDHGVPSAEVWSEVLRVLKPGAFCLAFGGTRTFHRLTCAIEDAGFEIRDAVMWIHSQGFPKSMDISKALDKAEGVERPSLGVFSPEAIRWSGYGTALKPAWEPCIVAMKPLDGTFAQNALKHGVAGLHIEAGRIAGEVPSTTQGQSQSAGTVYGADQRSLREFVPSSAGRWPANLVLDREAGAMLDAQTGTLKSGSLTRKATLGGDVRPGGWVDGPRTEAFFVGSEGGASRFFYCAKASRGERNAGVSETGGVGHIAKMTAQGGAWECLSCGRKYARALAACPKCGATERETYAVGSRPVANAHPCVKPLDLNRYLASLILPPSRQDAPRRILVPFSGSGSEMIGALQAGWDEAVGIEKEAEYVAIAEARLAHWIKPVDSPAPEPEPQAELPPLVDDFTDLPLFVARVDIRTP